MWGFCLSVETIAGWGEVDGYFADAREASAFRDELKFLMVTQRVAFNAGILVAALAMTELAMTPRSNSSRIVLMTAVSPPRIMPCGIMEARPHGDRYEGLSHKGLHDHIPRCSIFLLPRKL